MPFGIPARFRAAAFGAVLVLAGLVGALAAHRTPGQAPHVDGASHSSRAGNSAGVAQAPHWIEIPTQGGPTVTVRAATLFHTLASDFFLQDDGTVYVQTGDIPAMWLRDSAAQTLPYVRFSTAYPEVGQLAHRVIEHEARNVLSDAYANAFTAGYKVWEQKWEVDSLAFPVTLMWVYWLHTHDRSLFSQKVHWMMRSIVDTYSCEQHHNTCSRYFYGELPNHGHGAPSAETGMIWSGFRPSDDPCVYPFNVPQNMFAVVALRELAVLADVGYGDRALALEARQVASLAQQGIERYGRVYAVGYGWIYAYEVDGLGHALAMDDANLPDLLSTPYFGYLRSSDPLYVATRRFVLSRDDPYFYDTGYAAGLGSPHTPQGWIWPLGIITRALTATDTVEMSDAIRAIAATDGSDGLMHESFDPHHPWRFTRPEFGWANAMNAELVFRTAAGSQPERFDPEDLSTALPRTAVTPTLAPRVMQWENVGAIGTALRHVFAICAQRMGRAVTERPCIE